MVKKTLTDFVLIDTLVLIIETAKEGAIYESVQEYQCVLCLCPQLGSSQKVLQRASRLARGFQ
jgi:hypothetical protein